MEIQHLNQPLKNHLFEYITLLRMCVKDELKKMI